MLDRLIIHRYTTKHPIQNPAIIPRDLAFIRPYEINNILLGNGVSANNKVPLYFCFNYKAIFYQNNFLSLIIKYLYLVKLELQIVLKLSFV